METKSFSIKSIISFTALIGISLCSNVSGDSKNKIQLEQKTKIETDKTQTHYQHLLEEYGKIKKIKKWYLETAKKGDQYAQFILGLLLHRDGDVSKAKLWYGKSATQGHKEAQNNYGVLWFNEGKIKNAKKWFEKSANQNCAAAKNNLGVIYHDTGNLKKAQFLYQKAAKQEDSAAQTNLALMLLEQDNNSKDAKKLFEKASKKGHPSAQNNLGFLLYEEGNIPEAKKMFEMSADQELATAQHNLGCILHNEGKTEDAKKLFEKAASQGYSPSQNNTYNVQKDTNHYISKIVVIDSMGQVNKKGSVSFYASGGGHFIIGSKINNVTIRFLLDTGATNVVLSKKDAKKLGIDLNNLNYNTKVATAKGIGYVSCFNLRSIKIGNIAVRNVKTCIIDHNLSRSLLGMSFLNKITRYEVSQGRITFSMQ
ncbi:MAG: TIGR02281 family clan AA aspartic protease [Rickettsiales bacterium]|nr:TIGR02281 family clan AA aspartic protease [Rickettsiales bacterium]